MINKWKKGFTFIELLIVFAVTGVIFSLGFASYRDFSQRQILTESANLLRQDLLFAQQQALSAVKPAGCAVLNGYSVTFAATSYQVNAVCTNSTYAIKSANLSPGITKTGGPGSITFKVLAQGTTSANNETIVLTQSSASRQAEVNVSTSGVVEVALKEYIAPTSTPTPTTPPPTPTPSPSPDTTSPNVAVTAPSDGAIVPRNSTVTITAIASDNVAVARVEFYINGALHTTDTTSPYSASWNVPGAKNKPYTIQATAFDSAGNSSSHSITVTSSN